MLATTVPTRSHFLNADEVRALGSRQEGSDRKNTFLRAIVGSMTEEEVDELEKRINQFAERMDDGGQIEP